MVQTQLITYRLHFLSVWKLHVFQPEEDMLLPGLCYNLNVGILSMSFSWAKDLWCDEFWDCMWCWEVCKRWLDRLCRPSTRRGKEAPYLSLLALFHLSSPELGILVCCLPGTMIQLWRSLQASRPSWEFQTHLSCMEKENGILGFLSHFYISLCPLRISRLETGSEVSMFWSSIHHFGEGKGFLTEGDFSSEAWVIWSLFRRHVWFLWAVDVAGEGANSRLCTYLF